MITESSCYCCCSHVKPSGKASRTAIASSTGDHSKEDLILVVKIGKYTVFCVYHRSYLLPGMVPRNSSYDQNIAVHARPLLMIRAVLLLAPLPLLTLLRQIAVPL